MLWDRSAAETQEDLAEGAVYVLIRTADLAARRFESVVAIYQQT